MSSYERWRALGQWAIYGAIFYGQCRIQVNDRYWICLYQFLIWILESKLCLCVKICWIAIQFGEVSWMFVLLLNGVCWYGFLGLKNIVALSNKKNKKYNFAWHHTCRCSLLKLSFICKCKERVNQIHEARAQYKIMIFIFDRSIFGLLLYRFNKKNKIICN